MIKGRRGGGRQNHGGAKSYTTDGTEDTDGEFLGPRRNSKELKERKNEGMGKRLLPADGLGCAEIGQSVLNRPQRLWRRKGVREW